MEFDWRNAWRGEPHCLGCGYRLQGLSKEECPECGRAFNPRDGATFKRVAERRRFSVAAFVVIGLSILFVIDSALRVAGVEPSALLRGEMVAAVFISAWLHHRRRRERGFWKSVLLIGPLLSAAILITAAAVTYVTDTFTGETDPDALAATRTICLDLLLLLAAVAVFYTAGEAARWGLRHARRKA